MKKTTGVFELANGWTKESVMKQIKKYNNNEPCVNDNGNCVYRDKKGNRCAIGCFIPDGHVALRPYGYLTASQLIDNYPELAKYMPFSSREALGQFQTAHDLVDRCDGKTVYGAIKKFLDTKVK